MFFRLYVLIQQNFNTFNVIGVYSYNEALNKKNELSFKFPLNQYTIQGPFDYNNNISPFESQNSPFLQKNPYDIKPPFIINSINMNGPDKMNEN
tara:strand:+ start:5877 stop:6158 length:282 start_codon:yes stop_codon:yes gene_type:complete